MSGNERTQRLEKTLQQLNDFAGDNDYVSQVRYGPSLEDVMDSGSDIDIAREEIKQNFKLLFFTIPGEIHTDPNRGIGIQRFLFEMNNPNTPATINSVIYSQVSRYLPSITITNIYFNPYIEDNSLSINISYYIPSLDVNDNLGADLSETS